MDFQFAFWQMIYLLISPQKVFRDFQYRKRKRKIFTVEPLKFVLYFCLETKNQWARDDPAFLVLLSLFLLCKRFELKMNINFFLKLLI